MARELEDAEALMSKMYSLRKECPDYGTWCIIIEAALISGLVCE